MATYEERYQRIFEFITSVIKLEEDLKRELIEDELTGVYLIPKIKMDSYFLKMKEKAIPLCSISSTAYGLKFQKNIDVMVDAMMNQSDPKHLNHNKLKTDET